MKKGENKNSIEGNSISYLSRLVKVLEEAVVRLENDYKNNNSEDFNKSKKFILEVQKRISDVLK